MKNYIFDNDDGYIKKCETVDCSNQILVGCSSRYCIRCLEKQGTEIQFKVIPHYEQRKEH